MREFVIKFKKTRYKIFSEKQFKSILSLYATVIS